MAPPTQCSHIVEAIIIHAPKHSNDVSCSEGQLCLQRHRKAGVRPAEALTPPPLAGFYLRVLTSTSMLGELSRGL